MESKEERNKRVQDCLAEVAAVLEKYTCRMEAKVEITGNNLHTECLIIARDLPAPVEEVAAPEGN